MGRVMTLWVGGYRVVDDTVFNIFKVVARHGEPADVICAKEPFLMTQAGDFFMVTKAGDVFL